MVDGGSIALGEFVGCVLLGVDDHLMGGSQKAHHENTERLQNRPLLFGGCYFTQLYNRSFKIAVTKFMQERLRPISLQLEQQRRESPRGK